jgi:hypothetical protein
MLTAAQCQALANEYKSCARDPNIPKELADMLTNIARSFAGLSTQLDRLASYTREKARQHKMTVNSER